VWTVYIIENASKTRLYTGVTTDLSRRLREHNGRRRGGAKATRAGRPWRVILEIQYSSRSEAQQHERLIKGPSRAKKLLYAAFMGLIQEISELLESIRWCKVD
jgi:predicted GIY-YIG superfamily endonuclease